MEAFDGSKKSLSSLSGNSEFVHFALTSQDINNTAIPLALKDCITDVIKPQLLDLVHTLEGVCIALSVLMFFSLPPNGLMFLCLLELTDNLLLLLALEKSVWSL